MYSEVLQKLLGESGAVAASIADYSSGLALASQANMNFDIELATAAATEIMLAEMKTMDYMGLKNDIEDILITLGEQYYLMRPVSKQDGLFLYYVLNRSSSNLALARRALSNAEKSLN